MNPPNVRVTVASRPPGGRFTSTHYPRMSAFDPNDVRKAVAEFTPRHQQKFENLLPARDVIVELRQRRASFRAIAELLTQHCMPTGKTAIADFCHEVLGETIRSHRRAPRKRLPAVKPEGETKHVLPAPATTAPGEPPNPEAAADRPRGPRIAQIRKLTPQNHEKTDSHP
ncbi:MAG: hypothetical protein V9H26_12750 [Verrucomicrobiota bacterium]